jgi:cysteine desulfurase
MTVYLDCAATTPIEPEVRDLVLRYMVEEFGNAGSRTHEHGTRAKRAVEHARDQVAAVVKVKRDEVVFTSGATESNNLALLGLAPYGEKTGRKHIVSTAIEHKAVLEPLEELGRRGFEVTLVLPTRGGWVEPAAVQAALRPDTLLVSVMHANNETGVVQPIAELAELLGDHPAYFHTDAAQGFGKDLEALRHPRVDLISVSGHKLYAPKGVGALVARRRGYDRVPLSPLMFGGGQERGLRPGTLPVHLIVGLGLAAELAVRDARKHADACTRFREQVLAALLPVGARVHGEPARTLPHVLNVSFPGVDSEALMIAWKGLVEVSNGSACTSHSYKPSHVLEAMGLTEDAVAGAVRLSWSHLTPIPTWARVAELVADLRSH